MHRDRLTRLITVLCVMAAMVAILLGVGLWMYVSIEPEPSAPSPSAAISDELTTREDLQPDRSKLYQKHEGVLTGAAGESVSLAGLRGQPTVLLFWSSWCGDCKEYLAGQFPQAQEAAEAAGARLLLVAREGVREETQLTAEACLDAYGLACGTLLDPGAALFQQLGLRSVPSMAFFNSDGVLMHTTADMPGGDEMAAMLAYTCGGAAEQTKQLLAAMTQQGGVASVSMVVNAQLSPVNTVLSETQGLMMLCALEAEDQPLFDSALSYLRNHMTRSGLCAWQTENGKMAEVNASLDDLRIVQALLQAEEKWGGYAEEIAYRERALYGKCLQDGYLVDFVELESGAASTDVTLCYQDVAAMRVLAGYRSGWDEAADNAQALLQRGLISEAFPLYWPKYDPAEDKFYGDRLQMNEAMITVLNAARAGIVQQSTLDWLEARLREGYIAAAYTPDGQVAPGYAYESTATYALLVQIGAAAHRTDLALLAMQEMERLRCFEAPLAGGYGGTDGATLYTFDVVQALLAWHCWDDLIL